MALPWVNLKMRLKLKFKLSFKLTPDDAFRKEFRIQRSWEESRPAAVESFLKAQKSLSEINGLDIISLSKLKKGGQYQLRVKSESYGRYLPFSETPFDFNTDWYTVNFMF